MIFIIALLVAFSASSFIVSLCLFITAQLFNELITEETKKQVNVLTPVGMLVGIFFMLVALFLV